MILNVRGKLALKSICPILVNRVELRIPQLDSHCGATLQSFAAKFQGRVAHALLSLYFDIW